MLTTHSRIALALLCLLPVAACGDSQSEEEEQAAEEAAVADQCAEICVFWADCNSGEVEDGVCEDHCTDLIADVSEDCFDLYAEFTQCQIDNLNCANALGTECATQRDAYYSCESETPQGGDGDSGTGGTTGDGDTGDGDTGDGDTGDGDAGDGDFGDGDAFP